MSVKGIRILDSENNVVSVKLPDILQEIHNGATFHWSILFLDSMGDLCKEKSIPEFEKEISNSKIGLQLEWKELNVLSKKFYQIIDLTLIGCKDKQKLRRFTNTLEMYKNCDIVIEIIDSSYWEVYSKDEQLINRLAEKFEEIEFLKPNYSL